MGQRGGDVGNADRGDDGGRLDGMGQGAGGRPLPVKIPSESGIAALVKIPLRLLITKCHK